MITVKDSLSLSMPDPTMIDMDNDERKLASVGGNAEVIVNKDAVHMTNQNYGVVVSNYGNIIKGPSHLADSPSNIRVNGFWTLNDDLLTCLPSTTYTPIPVLVYKESPYVKMVQAFIKSLQ